MKPQAYFTSTSVQFKDSSWTPDKIQGLGDSNDILFITAKPIINTAKTLINMSKVVSPVLVKGGKKILNKASKDYDDLTLGMTKQVNQIVPKVNNVKAQQNVQDFVQEYTKQTPNVKNKMELTGNIVKKIVEEISK